MFAQSQPNLLSIMDDDSDHTDQPMSNDDFDSPMSIGSLRASLSNPNLLDSEENDTSDKVNFVRNSGCTANMSVLVPGTRTGATSHLRDFSYVKSSIFTSWFSKLQTKLSERGGRYRSSPEIGNRFSIRLID